MGVKFETFVLDLLPSLGLTPLAHRYKIMRGGVEVGEVDVLAEDADKKLYAVEIKAGKVDVSGIRQAYINAKLLEAKPVVVCRGYADESAKKLAEELGVEVIILPDYVFLSIDELVGALTSAFIRSVAYVLRALAEIDESTAYALIECPDYYCFCEKVKSCDEVLRELNKKLPVSYDALRSLAAAKMAIKDMNRQTSECDEHRRAGQRDQGQLQAQTEGDRVEGR
ncbi:MAG: endonuclease NucS [Thermoproteus sp.]